MYHDINSQASQLQQGGLFIKQVQIIMILIIIDPVQDTVEKVGSTWDNFHVIMGMIASN